MASKKKETYAEAMARLEAIVNQIDKNELDIDQLADKIRKPTELWPFAKRN